MIKDRITISARGVVTPFLVVDGREVPLGASHNAVQHGGAEAIVRSLGGGGSLSRVYFLYANTSSPSSIGASSQSLTASSFVTAGSASGRGLISCPAFASGFESSDEIVDTGVFMAVTDVSDASHVAGDSFVDGRYVYAVGLVMPATTGDVLYAACDIPPIAKAANSQIGVRWKTTITID